MTGKQRVSGSPFHPKKAELVMSLVKIIGWDGIDKIANYYAGRDYLYIPKKFDPASELAYALGEDLARKLIEFAPRERLGIHTASKKYVATYRRHHRLMNDILAQKHTSGELARRHRYSVRWVREIAHDLGVRLPMPRRGVGISSIRSRLRAEGTSDETVTAIALETGRDKGWIARLASQIDAEVSRHG